MTEETLGRDPEWIYIPEEDRPVSVDELGIDKEEGGATSNGI